MLKHSAEIYDLQIMTIRSRVLSLAITIMATAAIAITPTSAVAQSSNADFARTQQSSSQLVAGSTSYDLIHRSFTQAGVNREYHIAIPAFFDATRSYPVIIGFGGWQETATRFRDYSDLEQAARGNAIIIYAQGVNNAWAGAPYASTTMSQDINYARAAITDVITNFSGDADRVYATGLSNGGGMAAALSCHAPELVHAIATVAGAFYNPTVTGCMGSSVPTLLMHGTDDGTIAYGGGTRHGAPYRSVYQTFESFAFRNGCTTAIINQTTEHYGTTTFRPAYCFHDTEIVRVNGGGHTWFNDPRAEDVVWEFFRRQG